jgi:AraC family transcriptional regulator, exoenzyme S synthesis regulatory protein ExsA
VREVSLKVIQTLFTTQTGAGPKPAMLSYYKVHIHDYKAQLQHIKPNPSKQTARNDYIRRCTIMVNLFDSVLKHRDYHRQFNCGESLITVFNCPLEARLMKKRLTDVWSQYNYVFYVIEGRKIWHSAQGSYDLKSGDCVFVRKGAHIIEQFFDEGFCLILFFIPDEFICETLKMKANPLVTTVKTYDSILMLNGSENIASFFLSMSRHFNGPYEPDATLLELKFRELILMLADDRTNAELLACFYSLMYEPQSASLQRVMHDNYRYNLKLEQYAELSNRSLSSFKRDFQKLFDTTPGKWLLEKRLQHARHLLIQRGKTVNETAFECGFENPSHFSRSFKLHFGTSPVTLKRISASV